MTRHSRYSDAPAPQAWVTRTERARFRLSWWMAVLAIAATTVFILAPGLVAMIERKL